jgi:hypothetical protein
MLMPQAERRTIVGESDYKCANCGKAMGQGDEVYGLGTRLKEELEYPGGVGRTIAVTLPVGGRELECMVTADCSQAKLEGWDLIFMVCSEDCGEELKSLLEEENSLFEEIM